MSNLATFTISGDEYVDLETASGVTLTLGYDYIVQPIKNDLLIREGTTGEGHKILENEKFPIRGNDTTIYIKGLGAFGRCKINISSASGIGLTQNS